MSFQIDPRIAQTLTSTALNQYMNQTMTPEQWRSLLPQQQPMPQVPPYQFNPTGPYGNQAASMAGLLGRSTIPKTPTTGILGVQGGM